MAAVETSEQPFFPYLIDLSVADREAIMKRAGSLLTGDPKSWDELWKEKVIPWDQGAVQPPLKALIEAKELNLPSTGRAIVPGCGGGYDTIFLGGALKDYKVYGLDISPTALETARKNLTASGVPNEDNRVQFLNENFFELDPKDDSEKFDLIYDYTFFVAILPSMRKSWGSQMCKLVKKGGYLVTLVYPIVEFAEGPPYYVRPEHYPPVLGDGWEKVVDRVPENSAESHIGKEKLVVWKKL